MTKFTIPFFQTGYRYVVETVNNQALKKRCAAKKKESALCVCKTSQKTYCPPA